MYAAPELHDKSHPEMCQKALTTGMGSKQKLTHFVSISACIRLHTVIVDEDCPVDVQQAPVIAGQAERPVATHSEEDLTSELQLPQLSTVRHRALSEATLIVLLRHICVTPEQLAKC